MRAARSEGSNLYGSLSHDARYKCPSECGKDIDYVAPTEWKSMASRS